MVYSVQITAAKSSISVESKGGIHLSIDHLFKAPFRPVQGGLFQKVTKADVGDGAIRLMEQGVTLLCWADPFFPDPSTPPKVRQAALEAIQGGHEVHYTMPIGSPSLKEAIGRKLRRQGFTSIDPQRNILITPGSDSGLFYAMFPFLEPGDEVLIPDPSYPNNTQNALLMGAVPVRVPLKAADHYRLPVEEFRRLCTARTKMVVLTNPNNPTSTVFSQDDIAALSQLIVEKDLILVVDQAFEDILFDGRTMAYAALEPEMWERTITVCSVSKGMGLSGYRVGYLVADDRIMDRLYGAAVTVQGAANTLAQIAAQAAFEDESFLEPYRQCYDRRRRYLYQKFTAVPGIKMQMPQSSFLAWIDVSALGDSTEVMEYLVREARCLVNDGKSYGPMGQGHLRISYGCVKNDDELFAAVDRMAAALERLAAGASTAG